MSIECYAQRLLNPFRGVTNTIRYESAEAVTLDGLHWDIYVSNEKLLDDLHQSHRVQVSDIRYGSWSLESGLKRGPLFPSEDFRLMEEMGATVYEHLTRVHQKVPFPFQDCFELWLLDGEGQPLALLESVVSEHELDLDRSVAWRVGFAACEHFSSPVMQTLGAASPAAGEYLMRYINARAGESPAAQWFWRLPNGSGIGMPGIHLPTAWESRTLDLADFPALFLSQLGHDEAHQQLIHDFHAWQAPWLLLLSHLDLDTRRLLERHARRQALEVMKHHRLYPPAADENEIKAALVEAILRRSQADLEQHQDNTMSTYYIELHPSPGGDRSI
ncbi:MAG: hypothetical protein AABY73_12445 [Pseudomonadota bacterium]